MEQKVCLDTDVIIAILNNEKRASGLIDIISNYEIFITTVTLFELLLRETHLEEIEDFRNNVQLLELDEQSSRKASLILKDLKKKGMIIDFRDLFISSICIINNCRLATFNKKHFQRIEEFGLILI